jgi:uncharacterized protein (TIGR03085 family)
VSEARIERAALVETLRRVGPDAPTLCEGWTARDLAAHLLARERRLDALPGIVLRRFAGRTERIQHDIAESLSWEAILERLAAGPPIYSPFKWLDPVANVHELFVHHEDLRRTTSGWETRRFSDAMNRAFRRLIATLGPPVAGGIPVRLTLRTPDKAVVTRMGRGPAVTVTAEAGELLLFVFGRNEIHAEFEGDRDAVHTSKTATRRV